MRVLKTGVVRMRLVAITLEGRHIGVVRTAEGVSGLRAVPGTPGDDAVFERIDLAHGRVALRSRDGSYLARHARHGAQRSDGGPYLSAELTQCAAFEELLLPCGQVSLRGCDLRYLGVHQSGRVVADRVVNGSRERFTYVEVPARSAPAPAPAPAPTQPYPSTLRIRYAPA